MNLDESQQKDVHHEYQLKDSERWLFDQAANMQYKSYVHVCTYILLHVSSMHVYMHVYVFGWFLVS